jgi:hypothetical protein
MFRIRFHGHGGQGRTLIGTGTWHRKRNEYLFPSFPRRGGCAIKKKIPFLSGADGVVRSFEKIMCASLHL